ncbi:hypothetical protein PR048_008660 [Dryococelus australis]|uniref:HAT C-terminal dimerisation domain-containing protein n=1 Tax=Dryococelus australis TaxID=614101 RepID=A0ABQ9HXR2_9NEOP|nr:hypothetical protein PR048_008660 [Dryococelus australis]
MRVHCILERCLRLPAVLFPVLVVIHWNSWFNSVLYLAQYTEGILKFFSNECEFRNSSIEYIVDMFKDSNAAVLLKVQIRHLSTDLEGSDYPYAHKLQDELTHCRILCRGVQTVFFPTWNHSICSNAVVKEGVKGRLKSCIQRCLLTLANHMANRTSVLYQNDRKRRWMKSVQNECRMQLPFLSDLNVNTFYFHKQLLSHVEKGDKCNVQLLLAVKLKYPKFSEAALRCLWLPASSLYAEWFFSKLNLCHRQENTDD